MGDSFPLQSLKDRQHLQQKSVDLQPTEGLIFLATGHHIFMEIHFITLHKKEQANMLFRLSGLSASTLALYPAVLGFMQADSEQRNDTAMPNLVDLLEDLQHFFLKGQLFDYVSQLCLSVREAADEVATFADELLEFKLFERVKVEGLDRLAETYLHLIIIKMKVQVVSHRDRANLDKIKQTLMSKWLNSKANTQASCQRFEKAINPHTDEYAYAIMLNAQNQIVLVASLFAEYKLTRNLCTTYHLQIEYKDCNQDDELFFQREAVKLIPGYKISGLNVTESEIFKPHQVFMDINLFDPSLMGRL